MSARVWRVYALLGSLAIAGYAVLPATVWRDFWYEAVALSSACAIWAGSIRYRPRGRVAWFLIGAGIATYTAGDISESLARVFAPGRSLGISSGLYIAGYVVIALGLFVLVRLRSPGNDRAALIDTAILTTGLATVCWVFLVAPYLSDSLPLGETLVAISSPLGDLVIFAVAARVLLGIDEELRIRILIGAALVLLVGGDAFGAAQGLGEPVMPHVFITIGWLCAFVMWGTAALHPAMRQLSERTREPSARLSSRRLAMLAGATLLAPAMTVLSSVRANDLQLFVTAGASALLFLLVIARLLGVVKGHREAQERERLLREAAAGLVAARDRSEMYAIAVDTAYAIAVGSQRGRITFASGSLDRVVIVAGRGEGAERLIGVSYDVAPLVELGLHQSSPAEIEAFPDELGLLVAFPLLVHGEPRGVIMARTPHHLTEPVRGALQALGAQVGLALEGATLTDELLERQSEERFRSLVQSSSDVIAILEPELRIRYHTPSAETALGYGAGELVGRSLEALFHDEDRESFRALMGRLMYEPGIPAHRELRLRHHDGTTRTFAAVFNNLLDDANVRGIVMTAHDVTERNALERQLTHQAFHDSLTGLPNRALFVDRIQHALNRTRPDGATVAVLFIDLDDFKTVNDSLGHAVGDELLIAVGERLIEATRTSDSTARLGGDEFAVLLEDVETEEEAVEAATRVLEAIARPLPLEGQAVTVHASVGIALADAGQTVGELVRNADAAMYTAKAAGKSRYTLFEQRMHTAALERLEIRAELQHAAESKAFTVHYQPLVDLRHGGICGFEALLRWPHPERGLVLPNDFISILEDTGLIVPVGELVLERACAAAEAWRRHEPELTMNVNLSGRQLLDSQLVSTVRGVLARTRLPAHALVLEITESVLMTDTEAAMERLEALKRIGVRLAIDDFGTGYSSLNYLRRLPVDILKIAKPFVDEIGVSAEATRLAEGIIRLGKTLSLSVVAEGIERSGQRDRLRELYCDIGQGYLFSRPVDAGVAEAMLDVPEALAA